jgi:hypothetical protein
MLQFSSTCGSEYYVGLGTVNASSCSGDQSEIMLPVGPGEITGGKIFVPSNRLPCTVDIAVATQSTGITSDTLVSSTVPAGQVGTFIFGGVPLHIRDDDLVGLHVTATACASNEWALANVVLAIQ